MASWSKKKKTKWHDEKISYNCKEGQALVHGLSLHICMDSNVDATWTHNTMIF